MSDFHLLLAAAATAAYELSPADSGAGAPPRIPGHEADRLASMGTAAPARRSRQEPRGAGTPARWRRFGIRPATAAPPS
ncbi:hypothetical protein [Peterkaempfera griseoplana]|uniref:hypothetical protein n=1 Tax=Peterkaempfera griseoplana TaxID=66896 RepID=UPI0006E3C862|nr:hypothetical protein [Peterkaempfera griseoplana]